jgi:predicted ester cyclase
VSARQAQAQTLVHRLVEEVVNARSADSLDEIASGDLAVLARRWIDPFRSAFPDFRMKVEDVIVEGDRVAAYFTCSGTHEGTWLGHPPTHRRFENVAEVYFFRVQADRLTHVDAVVEDNLDRLRQLGLAT